MKKTLLFAFALTVLAFSSCTAKKGFVTKLPKQEIANVQRPRGNTAPTDISWNCITAIGDNI